MILKRYYLEDPRIPPNFTKEWIIFYGKILSTQMIVSNVLPYAKPLLSIAFKRRCCCCKKKDFKIQKGLNSEAPIERRYGTILSTVFVAFTYGYAMPAIFLVCAFVLLFQFVCDKLLITYYYRERVLNNDLLNRLALGILKYAAAVFFLFGGLAVQNNYCSQHNNFSLYVETSTELIYCAGATNQCFFLWTLAWTTFTFFLMKDLFTKEDVPVELKDTYFERISEYQRKRWICEEHYLRQNYGIHTMSEQALTQLKKTPGKPYTFAKDPATYSLLMNPLYEIMLNYKALPLCTPGCKQYERSDLAVRSLLGQLST